MSQLQEVVRCYSCETFQVQIKKKANKWICKICNEKQSLKKVYFTGLGAECRNVVKEFNSKRGELAETKGSLLLKSTEVETLNNIEYTGECDNTNQYDEESYSNEHSENLPKVSKWTNFLTPEEIKETERAFSKKNNSQTVEQNSNEIQDDEYYNDFEEFSEKEEDFDCESYLQMNSVNNKEDGFLQNTSKTFTGEDFSNSWNSYNSKRDFQKSSLTVKKRTNNEIQPVNSKKSKWSSFTSTNEISTPSENNSFENSNTIAASDMVYKTNEKKESDFRSASSISEIKQPLTFSRNPLKASTSYKQPLRLTSYDTKPLLVSKQPLASSTSFRQPSGASTQPLAASREPLSKQSIRAEPVMTDFAKKFLLNRK